MMYVRPISQTVFMLSIAINRAKQIYAKVISKLKYVLLCNHKVAKIIMLCFLNSTGHMYVQIYTRPPDIMAYAVK